MLSPFKLQIKDQDAITLERLAINGFRSLKVKAQPRSQYLKLPTKNFNNEHNKTALHSNSKIPFSLSPHLKISPLKPPSVSSNLEQESFRTDIKPKSSKHFFFSPSEVNQFIPNQGGIFGSPTLVKTLPCLEKIDEKVLSHRYILSDQFLKIEPERDYILSATPCKMTTYSFRPISTSHSALRGSDGKELFLNNKKKYNVKSPENWFHKTNGFRAKDDINFIKSQAKFQIFRKGKMPVKVFPVEHLNLIGETDLLQKNRKNWTKEDEFKVVVLKKKMEIYGKFRHIINLEDRKNLYKQLILEYHPDKSRHKKDISEEIFTYLQSNKIKFLL